MLLCLSRSKMRRDSTCFSFGAVMAAPSTAMAARNLRSLISRKVLRSVEASSEKTLSMKNSLSSSSVLSSQPSSVSSTIPLRPVSFERSKRFRWTDQVNPSCCCRPEALLFTTCCSAS